MDGFMIRLLNMSFTASCACLLVMVLRVMMRRLPKVYSYALWGIVIFRFLCPITLESAVSLLPVSPEPVSSQIIYDQTPSVHSGAVWFDNPINQVLKETMTPETMAVSMNPIQGALFILEVIWMAGAAVFAGYHLISYLRLKKKMEDAVKLKRRIYASEKISSPFAMGIINPRIYLPYGLSKAEEKCIVAHEWVHIRRKDGLVKMLGILVLTLHWFNPFAWIGISLMCRDMEMACDEASLKHLGLAERRQYSMTLFNVSLKHSGLMLPTAFGEGNTKTRIRNILSYKKPAVWMSICAAAILVISAVTLMTNPKKAVETGDPEPAVSASIFSGDSQEAASISIIGGADGPTSVFLAGKLGGGASESSSVEIPLETLNIHEAVTPAAIGQSDGDNWLIYGDFGFYYFVNENGTWNMSPYLQGEDLKKVREVLDALRAQAGTAEISYLSDRGFMGNGMGSLGILTYDTAEREDGNIAVLGSFADSSSLVDLFFGSYDPEKGTLAQVYPFGGDKKTIVNEKGRISYRRYLFSNEGYDYFIRTPETLLDFESDSLTEGRLELVRFAEGRAEVLDNLLCLRDMEERISFDSGYLTYRAAENDTRESFERLVMVQIAFDGSQRTVVPVE